MWVDAILMGVHGKREVLVLSTNHGKKTSDDGPEVIREIVSPFRNLDRAIGYGCETL